MGFLGSFIGFQRGLIEFYGVLRGVIEEFQGVSTRARSVRGVPSGFRGLSEL